MTDGVTTKEILSERARIDVIIDRLDELLLAGKFAECDAAFRDADTDKLTDAEIVTYLGITRAAASKLTDERPKFYERALRTVSNRRGGSKFAEKLLSKYR